MANPAASDLKDRIQDRAEQPAATAAVAKREKTIFDLIRDQEAGFARALPSMISAERFVRVAITAIRTKPALARCTQQSLLGALMLSAQLGLEPSGPLGHAYLVPFGNEVTFIIGYKGMIDLARRSGAISSIYAECVYEGDEFSWQRGLHPDIVHKPLAADRDDASKITHVYAVARFKGEGEEPQFEVLTRAQVETYRKRSKQPNGEMWTKDYPIASKKTALRRLFSWLPSSVETSQAIASDERVIDRIDVTADDFIDVEGEDVTDPETAKKGDGTDTAPSEADGTESTADASASEADSKSSDGPGRQESGDGAAEPDPTQQAASADDGAATFDCDICEGTGRAPDGSTCKACDGTGTAAPAVTPAEPKTKQAAKR